METFCVKESIERLKINITSYNIQVAFIYIYNMVTPTFRSSVDSYYSHFTDEKAEAHRD